MRALALALLGCLTLASPLRAQDQDYSKVEIKTTEVGKGVYMLVGAGGNLGVSVGADGVLLVDDQFAPLTPKIQAAIQKLSDKPVRFLVNTHWHFDHSGGNENFGRAGATIVAHDNVRVRMSKDQVLHLATETKVPASPAIALPVLTFADAVTFHWNGGEIRAFHVPNAHTDGDVIVHFPAQNVIHMGDTFWNGLYPFIDLDSGGSVDGMIAATERGLALANDTTAIIPGHGPLGKKPELTKFHDMLKTIRDRVAAAIAAGKSADETLAAKPSAEFDELWGKGFMPPAQFLRTVYADLSRNK